MDPKVELPMTPGAGHDAHTVKLQQGVAESSGESLEATTPVTAETPVIPEEESAKIYRETGEDVEKMFNPDTNEGNQKPKVTDAEPEEGDGTLSNTRELAGQYFTTSTPPPRIAPNEIGSKLEAARKAKMEGN